jgi:Schlafen, AlbA_2
MINKRIELISKEDIDALILDQVPESKSLEYKLLLPGETDSDKKEFLADASSFANAAGGDLIYGVREKVDAEGNNTGRPDSVEPLTHGNEDQNVRRIESIIRAGIEPRIAHNVIAIRGWGGGSQDYVLLIRIQKLPSSPHMVVFKGTSRFYSRTAAGKFQLDVGDIRNAILATDAQADRIRRFVEDRLAKQASNDAPMAIESDGRLVLHIIPINGFLNRERIVLPTRPELMTAIPPIRHGGYSGRFNLDGFLTFNASGTTRSASSGYCQLFFDGVLEAVHGDFVREVKSRKAQVKVIASVAYEQDVIVAMQSYLKGLESLGVQPPLIVAVSLVGCKGAYLATASDIGTNEPIDRDVALLPSVTIENFNVSVPQVMKPVFDAVWNACGFERSANYDQAGAWKPRPP